MDQQEATAKESLYLVKIKKERLDPEIEHKINAISVKVELESERVENVRKTRTTSNTDDEEGEDDDGNSNSNATYTTTAGDAEEDKKSIEPVKSSNEILAELFKVFNAQPPEELFDDKNLMKKSHKHKKHKKEKKKKLKREKPDGDRSDSDTSNSHVGSSKSGSKHKHKKKKKHKHKEEREKEKSKDKGDKEKDKSKEKEKSKDKAKDKSKDITKEKSKERDTKKIPLPTRIKEEPDERRRERRRHGNVDADVAVPAKISRNGSGRDRSRERDRERDKERDKKKERHKEKERGHNSFYNGFRDGESVREKERHRDDKIKAEPSELSSRHRNHHDRDGHCSEISLSDEETYLRERVSDSSRRRTENERSHAARAHNSFYSGMPRSRSRDRANRYRRDADSGRGRSRSRSRSRDLGIDKKRLLEIARKNAISMFKRGNLPGCAEMTEEVKDKVLLKMRYGGRTVQDLTDFCKKISNGENLSDLSSDEDSDTDKNGNAKAFHHPFLLKERDPIVMHIRNSTTIAPRKTDDQTKAITMQFPVSSGQQHRMTEGWVPVEPKDKLVPLPSLPTATQSTNIFKGAPTTTKNIFAKPMPQQEEQEPAFKAVPVATATVTTTPDSITDIALPSSLPPSPPTPVPAVTAALTSSTPAIAIPKPVPPVAATVAIAPVPAPVPPPQSSTFVPDVPLPSVAALSDSIFPQASQAHVDVSSIISKRLNAMRRLQENPMDSEAIKMMYNSQKEMTSWASSKYLPGQFTGSTGVNVLKARELNSGPQVWARRDQLTSTRPLAGGMGMHLLQKMGWKPGEGLGREKTGSLQPLLLDVKLDKRGLVAKDDNGYQHQQQAKKQRSNNVAQAQQAITDKHPVCLLNELTSKRKWTPPLYELVNEAGPSHSKMFMFSVSINGQLFTPNQASNTKKEAKLLAARNCLQQMGILPM